MGVLGGLGLLHNTNIGLRRVGMTSPNAYPYNEINDHTHPAPMYTIDSRYIDVEGHLFKVSGFWGLIHKNYNSKF